MGVVVCRAKEPEDSILYALHLQPSTATGSTAMVMPAIPKAQSKLQDGESRLNSNDNSNAQPGQSIQRVLAIEDSSNWAVGQKR